MIYVYTSILNGWDQLRPPLVPADGSTKYICFTNGPHYDVPPWEFDPASEIAEASRASRAQKIRPHLFLPRDCEYSIWHDGNFQLRIDPREIVDKLLHNCDWAAHRHPCRDCIYDEAKIIERDCPLVPKDEISAEIERYRQQGFPVGAGLWANGMIVRRHTPQVAELNERWWELYAEGCGRDQLSFPVARKEFNLPIETVHNQIYESPYMAFNWHTAFVRS